MVTLSITIRGRYGHRFIRGRLSGEYHHYTYKLLQRCRNQPSNHTFRFKNPLYSLDASATNLSLKLFPWAAHREDTCNVKLSVGLNHSSQIPEFVALSNGNENDMVKGREFRFPKDSIVAFDKGHVDYSWYKSLTDHGIFFVTRLWPNSIYRVLERRDKYPAQGITRDQIIQLNSTYTQKWGAPRLRRVRYYDKEAGKHYVFVTNHFPLSTATIPAIYKDRWRVEIFFKTIKQNLKIKAFVGTSGNAVLSQIGLP